MRHVVTLVLTTLLLIAPALSQDARIDRFKASGWSETDFSRISIELSEILSGGPPKDGIPSIDKPKFVSLNEAKDLVDREPVIGLEINGDARAYPLRVLTWHEIVNDKVGGVPVTVTYCPLCNAAIVFERRVAANVLDFGTTGLLRNSDLVMYDRQTQSWWQQFTGEAIVGKMLGTKLKTVPARLEAFELFKKRHPEGKVLVPNNPDFRDYGRNPYAGYDTNKVPFLYRGDMPEGIPAMARVVVYRHGGTVHAVALDELSSVGEMRQGDVILKWSKGQASALDTVQIAKGRDVGNVTVQLEKGDKRTDIAYDVTFAFVVTAFHPNIEIVKK